MKKIVRFDKVIAKIIRAGMDSSRNGPEPRSGEVFHDRNGVPVKILPFCNSL